MLRQADPALNVSLPTFETDPLDRAISANKSKKSWLTRLNLASAKARRSFLAGGFATVAAGATLALALPGIVAPEALIELGANPEYRQSSSKIGSADSMMSVYGTQEFVAGSSLSNETSTAHVYEFKLVGSPRARLQDLANLFEVAGDVKRQDFGDENNQTYMVGDQNYASANVSIFWSGTGGWSYFSGSDSTVISKSSATPEETTDDSAAKSNFPSKADAIKQALEIFSATGLNVDASDVNFYSDEWSAIATANLKVDGFDTALEWNVSWGTDGKINGAYGQSATVIDRGEYATVSAQEAVTKRMSDFRWTGQLPNSAYASLPAISRGEMRTDDVQKDDFATEGQEPAAVPGTEGEPSEPGDAVTDQPEPGDVVTGQVEEPKPGVGPDVEPTMPTVTKIRITKAKATLLTIYDSNGKAWLVPGFEMSDSKYWISGVVSLIDGVIELPEIIEMDIESK